MKLPENISASVQQALEEDIGSGDVTADLIAADAQATATVVCRDDAVLSGKAWFDEVFVQIDPSINIDWNYADGDTIAADSILCSLLGNARSILSGERTALNFLQTLSATATATHQYVAYIEDTHAQVLDTRKTLPNLRLAQKYAVACGGGKNHRMALYDMILIKENHIMAAGSITNAIEQARALHPSIKVEVETENLQEFEEASNAQADIIMLDNYSLDDMRTAVAFNKGKEIKLEASGGITRETVRAIAETGVDYISIGEITKDIKAVDLSMRFQVNR